MKLPEKKSLLALPLVAALTACGGSDENIQNITQVTQGDVFEKVFEGKVTDPSKIEQHPANPRWVKLEQILPSTYQDLRAMSVSGSQFTTSVSTAAGGGSGSRSFPCLETLFSDNEGVFTCYGPQLPTGLPQDYYQESVSIAFDGKNAYYVPTDNQPDLAGTIDLSFWASKNTPDSGAQK